MAEVGRLPITLASLDQAEARLAEAKKKKANKSMTEREYRTVKRDVVQLRVAWRAQEEAAGRRNGLVGGDVF